MEKTTKTENNLATILIVEDSPTQAEQLKYFLEGHNYKVMVSANGKEALELMSNNRPSVVISDIIMPEMTGYELCQKIKSDKNNIDIPVILLTSLSDSDDVLEGLACGADNFLTKPYNEDYLLSHIKQILVNRNLGKYEQVKFGMEIILGGKKRFISACQQQMLTLLISTYEAAVSKNKELLHTREELTSLNEHLEDMIKEKTAKLSAEIVMRKKTESKLKKIMSNLENTVSERTSELAEANKKLQTELNEKQKIIEKEKELNMLKTRFISVVSHEFRTPLAGVLTSVELLERFSDKWDADKKRGHFSRIYGNIRYTNLLLDDVSILGKHDSGKLQLVISPFSLIELMNLVVSDIYAVYGNEIPIEIEIGNKIDSVEMDETLLRHILSNIISNSVKYSKEANKVTVKITLLNDNLNIVVLDSGIGIPKEDLKFIFEPFHRAVNVETIKGTGLGLTIVKNCVQMMGGNISVESEHNCGTTVTLSLPIINEVIP